MEDKNKINSDMTKTEELISKLYQILIKFKYF